MSLNVSSMTGEVDDILISSPENGAKDGAATATEAPIKGSEPSVDIEPGADDPDNEADFGSAIYPPILEDMEVLGYVKDKNGINYPRDVGRSTCIHDEVFFIFGDTTCKDASGNSVGTTSNTVAYVESRTQFLDSEYMEISDNGMVKAFVPLDEQETRFAKENQGARIVFRMFGGAVDVGAIGIMWFQYVIEHANGEEEYRGVSQARLTTYSDGRIIVQRPRGLLFGPDEPSIGSFSTLYYNGHVYLWSHRHDGQIILARVDHLLTAVYESYEYWSGTHWVTAWQYAAPVLDDVQHGAIIYTHMFGKDKPFLFVGENKRADSMIQIGVATRVQGPFRLIPICKATGIDHDEKYKYCIYPHLFASNILKRELVVTWCEHPPGGVIAARLKFKINEVAAIREALERKIAREEQAEQEARRLAREMEEEARRLNRELEEEAEYMAKVLGKE